MILIDWIKCLYDMKDEFQFVWFAYVLVKEENSTKLWTYVPMPITKYYFQIISSRYLYLSLDDNGRLQRESNPPPLYGCWFESCYSHLNFRYRYYFEQVISEARVWHDKNTTKNGMKSLSNKSTYSIKIVAF